MKKLIVALSTLAVTGLVAAVAPAQPAPHLGIELRTYAPSGGIGDSIRADLDPSDTLTANGVAGALEAGPPLSARQSCGPCHSYERITSAYHFQLGENEMVDANGDGFKDDLGKVLTGAGGLLASLPTLANVTSPGQFGGW